MNRIIDILPNVTTRTVVLDDRTVWVIPPKAAKNAQSLLVGSRVTVKRLQEMGCQPVPTERLSHVVDGTRPHG